jgi:hypothetical protein
MNRVRWGDEDMPDVFGDRLAEIEAEIAGTSAATMRAALVKLRPAVWLREQDTVPDHALLDGLLNDLERIGRT